MFTKLSLFQKHYKLIAIDLSKQQKVDVDPEAIQRNNFTGNLKQDENKKMFCIIEKTKETVLDFSKGTVRVLSFYFFQNQSVKWLSITFSM